MSKKMNKETLRRLQKNYRDRVRRRNKKFFAADKAGKRVIIAQDVIDQLNVGKIKAENLTYLASKELQDIISNSEEDRTDSTGEKQLKKELRQTEVCDILNKNNCTACALGSIFVSAVGINDKLKVKDVISHYGYETEVVSSDKMHSYLGSIFSKRQLHMIENAFEGSVVNELLLPNVTDEEKCVAFNGGLSEEGGIKNPKKRLIRIMENIIENNGTFVP